MYVGRCLVGCPVYPKYRRQYLYEKFFVVKREFMQVNEGILSFTDEMRVEKAFATLVY